MMQDFIKKNCLTKNGGLNNRVCLSSWWVNRGFEKEYEAIIEKTQFLNPNVKYSQRVWHVYHSIYTMGHCVVCQEHTKFANFSTGYNRTCSIQCSGKDPVRKEKISKNTDHASRISKSKKTNIERYGVDSPLKLSEFQKNMQSSKIAKYGSLSYNNIEKIRETNNKLYGANTFFGSIKGQELLLQRRRKNFGSLKLPTSTNILLNDIQFLIQENKTKSIPDIAESLGVTVKAITDQFKKHNHDWIRHPSRYQKMQHELATFFSKNYKVIENDRKSLLSKKELDILFPEKKVAIELNGIYWHSYNEIETNEQIMKHYNKLIECRQQGIDLIQFTDLELLSKKDIVISIIESRLGVVQKTLRASKCKISKVNTKDAQEFFNKNHIQGYAKASLCLGLYFEDELVYAMSFSRNRFSKEVCWEIVRAASLLKTRVHGGAGKLFKQFLNLENPNKVISYCDISKFTGNTYKALGFKFSHTSKPNYFYSKGSIVISRYQAQKHKLKKLLGDSYDESISESNNMFNNGFRRYWNCGNDVFVFNR